MLRIRDDGFSEAFFLCVPFQGSVLVIITKKFILKKENMHKYEIYIPHFK